MLVPRYGRAWSRDFPIPDCNFGWVETSFSLGDEPVVKLIGSPWMADRLVG